MIAFALYFTIGTTGDMVILKMPSQIWLLPYCRPRILGMPSYLEALLLHTKTFHTSCLGSSSFPKWAKLANIVPSMDINISNLPMCCYLLLPRGFFFFFFVCLSLWKAPCNREHHPPFHPFKEPFNIHMQNLFQHSNKNPFVT